MSNVNKAEEILARYFGTHDPYGISATQAAESLEHSGLLMPDLPESEPTYSGTQWVTTHSTTMHKGTENEYETGTVVSAHGKSEDERPPVAIGFGIGLDFMTADEARSIALALLAAADYAEKEQSNESRK